MCLVKPIHVLPLNTKELKKPDTNLFATERRESTGTLSFGRSGSCILSQNTVSRELWKISRNAPKWQTMRGTLLWKRLSVNELMTTTTKDVLHVGQDPETLVSGPSSWHNDLWTAVCHYSQWPHGCVNVRLLVPISRISQSVCERVCVSVHTAVVCLMLWKLTRVGDVGMDIARATRTRRAWLSCQRCQRFLTAERTCGDKVKNKQVFVYLTEWLQSQMLDDINSLFFLNCSTYKLLVTLNYFPFNRIRFFVVVVFTPL